MFEIQPFGLKPYNGCCNHHGCPGRCGSGKRSQKPEAQLKTSNLKGYCTFRAKYRRNREQNTGLKSLPSPASNHPVNVTECYPQSLQFYLMPEQKPSKRLFLSQAASCTHRRYLRLSFPPPDGQETPVPEEESVFHRQGVSFKHLQKNSGVLKDTAHSIVLFWTKSRKKSIFFLFLLKSAMKTMICYPK